MRDFAQGYGCFCHNLQGAYALVVAMLLLFDRERTVRKVRASALRSFVRSSRILLSALTVTASCQAYAACVGTNLAVNGGIESPAIAANSFQLRATNAVPGWTTDDNAIEQWGTNFQGVAAHSGSAFLEMNANSGTSILTQTPSAVKSRAELQVSWAHRGRLSGTLTTTPDVAQLLIADNGGGSSSSGVFSTLPAAWVVRSITHIVGPAATTATLKFDSISSAGGVGYGNFIDSVDVCQTYLTIAKQAISQNDVNGDGRNSVGDTVTYEYKISNPTGNSRSLSAVSVTDDKIGAIAVSTPLSGDTNINGSLDPGETWVTRANYNIAQADIDAGQVVNIAFASGNTGSNVIRSDAATVTAVFTKITTLAFDKKQNPTTTTPLVLGQIVEYFYEVTNTGNVTALNVNVADVHLGNGVAPVPNNELILTDVAPLGNSNDLGGASNSVWSSLAPGDTVRFKGQYTVVQADVDLIQ